MSDRTLLLGGTVAAFLGVVLMWVAPGVDEEWSAWHHGYRDLAEHDETAPEPFDGAPELRVRATEFSFEPDSLAIESGGPVNVVLDNDGRLLHDLVVVGSGFHLAADGGTVAVGGLGPLAPGRYRIECTVPGHATAGMSGVLVVSG